MARLNRREVLRIAAVAGATGLMASRLTKTTRASDAYSSVVLAKGPVGYWRLGNSIGPTAGDASGYGQDGTYLGGSALSQPGAIANDPDTAVGFNPPYVEIPDPQSASFSQPTSGFGLSVEIWMRPDALIFPGETSDTYVHWLGKGVAGQHEWALRFYSKNTTRPNRVSAYLWNPEGGEGAGAYFQDNLNLGEWMHVVACYEPGDQYTVPIAGVEIYKNGVKRLGPPSSGTLYSTYGMTRSTELRRFAWERGTSEAF